MKIKVKYLNRLLALLAEETGESLDSKGLKSIEEQITGLGSDYLYKKVHGPCAKLSDEDTLGLRERQLNLIAKFLGHRDIKAFFALVENPVDPQLLSFVGEYYNYVRRNTEKGILFRSPVSIMEREGKIWFELQGPNYHYRSEPKIQHGCLFVLMTATEGKAFHHVYKVGKREAPDVLQGVFSGVSTAFDPIGGRTVLVRRNNDSDTPQKHAELKITELKKSKSLTERRLAEYFERYVDNNLRIGKAGTFRIDDLGECD